MNDIVEMKRKPIIVHDMTSDMMFKEKVVFQGTEKMNIETSVPVGYVRCIVLRAYDGMTCKMLVGDVFDLPERRYKSLSRRGFIEKYEGKEPPCNKR
jgi:hypothetical protein